MALEMEPAVIHLRDVATGRTVAKLEDPHGDRAGWMGFTPDGTQLVVAATYAKAIHVWDLRAIRQRLKGMGLDWDWPEFRPADSPAHNAELAKVEVLHGDLANPGLTREQKARQAIAQFRRDVQADPQSAIACNNLAWIYLTAPVALRDVKAALPLAENAVRLDAGNGLYRNTLGLAYYRVGRYREAMAILRPNLDKQDDIYLAFDLYFLAMSHQRLGEPERARDYLAWAVRWTAAQRGLGAQHLEELNFFRAEAEELLETDNDP
jgi:tetratricopeptide (TPR) repeat protein